MVKTISAHFDGRKALAHVRHLAVTIGPRLTGTTGEHEAAAYIEKTFKSLKPCPPASRGEPGPSPDCIGMASRRVRTRLQRFPVQTFGSAKCRLEVLDGRKWRDVPIQPVGLSGSTPPGGITGELYFAETGEPEYYSPAMKGKIVLICGRVKPPDRYKLLAQKPRAIIFIEEHLSEEPARMSLRDEALEAFGKVPLGRLRYLDGLEIIGKGLTTARLTMVNAQRRSHCFNVIGEVRGTEYPDEIVVICAHYDTSREISGASDNAGGTAVMMELARVLSAEPTKRTLRFIAFAGEETGLQGSRHYAAELVKQDKRRRKQKGFNDKADKTELARHVLAFNLDVHGSVLGRHGFNYSGTDDLGAAVRLLAKELGMPAAVNKGPMSSDGSSLAAVGIPALQFARGGGTGGYLHSTLDDIRFISADALGRAGRFSEVLLKRYVTTAAALPFPREVPDDQKKALERFYKAKGLKKPTSAGKRRPAGRDRKAVKKAKHRTAR